MTEYLILSTGTMLIVIAFVLIYTVIMYKKYRRVRAALKGMMTRVRIVEMERNDAMDFVRHYVSHSVSCSFTSEEKDAEAIAFITKVEKHNNE